MSETLIFFAGASLLGISAATFVIAVQTLQTARRYVDLAEQRLELMRQSQDRLLAHMEEQRRIFEEEREEAEPDVHTYRGAGRSIERTKQELLGRKTVAPPPVKTPEPPARTEAKLPEEPRRAEKPRRPAGLPETRSPKNTEAPEAPPVRAVRHPHPDDVKPGSTLAGQVRSSGNSPVQMFRVFYDRYLDNYEGYVKLAERIHAARTPEETVPGSRATRDWEERMRRVNDGIERTTERLDILEHSNPELVSDDRVSRRAGIARSHARITK